MTTYAIQPREEYTEALPDVMLNRAAVKGERAVKALGVKALPPTASMCCEIYIDDITGDQSTRYLEGLSPEGKSEYCKYLSLASWYGATSITVTGLVGLIFGKKAVCELPNQVDYMKENVDGKGTTLRKFSKTACKEALITPWSGVLVAIPETPRGASRRDAELLNIKPKLLHYKFESILTWDYEVIDNIEKLSFVVLTEKVSKRTGFDVEECIQYRVLELIDGIYHQRILDENGDGNEAVPVIINGKTSKEIPFYIIESNEDGEAVINPLVDMNYQHFKVGADYYGGIHYSNFAVYYETGAEPNSNNNMIGNGVKWNNTNEGATFGILQPDGNADGSRIALQDIEQRMAALGAEALRPRTSGVESAESKSLDKVTQTSTAADIAIMVSEVITKALNFSSRSMGGAEDTEYMLNTDFVPTGMSAQDMQAQLNLVTMGELSSEQFYANLQRGEVANASRSYEDEQKLIANKENQI